MTYINYVDYKPRGNALFLIENAKQNRTIQAWCAWMVDNMKKQEKKIRSELR